MSGKLLAVLALILCGVSRPQAQTLDEVYKKALTEGGTLNFYGTELRTQVGTKFVSMDI